MKKPLFLELICGVLVLLFVYTGAAKLINFSGNLHDMHNQPFPSWMATTLAYVLPPAEMIIAAMLVFERTRRWGLYVYGILLLFFTLYIGAILLHWFPRVPCSCGGVIKYLTWTQHLWFNLFFLLLVVIALWLRNKILANSHPLFMHDQGKAENL